MASIKAGATFRVALVFTAEEWAEIYPHDSIRAYAAQGETRYPLTVTIDAPETTITLVADTSTWVVGTKAEFDVWVEQSGVVTPIPFAANMSIGVVNGVSR